MSAEFPTTEWQLIADACSPSIAQRRDALGRVFDAYRGPIEAWLRRLGADPDRSAEIAQDFFAKVLIERQLLVGADRAKGRLRTLLRTAVERYRVDLIRRDDARLRAESSAGQHKAAEIAGGAVEPDAARDFDAEWTRAQLEMTIVRARELMLATGREREWRVFELSTLLPAVHGTAKPSMETVAREVGLANAAIASNLLFQAKRRVAAMFREVVSETVSGAEDFRDELAHVDGVLRRVRNA